MLKIILNKACNRRDIFLGKGLNLVLALLMELLLGFGPVCFTCLDAFQMRVFGNGLFCRIKFIYFKMHASKVMFY